MEDEEFYQELIRAMTEPVDMTPCCDLDGRALHHHWNMAP